MGEKRKQEENYFDICRGRKNTKTVGQKEGRVGNVDSMTERTKKGRKEGK